MPAKKAIGELNGWWALLLKISLAIFPVYCVFLTGWAVWVTSETFANQAFRLQGGRMTDVDGVKLEASLKTYFHATLQPLRAEIHGMPPQDWRDRILKMEENQDTIHVNQIKILMEIKSLRGTLERNAVTDMGDGAMVSVSSMTEHSKQ